MKYSDYRDSKYLRAADLDIDEQRLLVITKIGEEAMIDGEKKLVAYFREEDKGLVLNRINSEMLEMLSGSDDPRDAQGLPIVLIRTNVEFKGKIVPALRIRRPPKPESETRPEPPKHGSDGTAKRPPIGEEISDEIPF
jgi:hypothetical protein